MNWYQQSLTPPDAVQVTLMIGIIPVADHSQWMVEVKDPKTGILIAQHSGPHRTYARLWEAVDEAVQQLRESVAESCEPF